MRTQEVVVALGLTVVFALSGAAKGTTNALSSAGDVQPASSTETREIFGWTVHVSKLLVATNAQGTAHALDLLESQLGEIVRNVPSSAVTELRKVPLWISPEYPGVNPRAEYHPNAGWLREHDRDPAMAKGVEFTNVRIFEAETRRMPNFALHELAHAYHDRVLPGGFDNKQIKAAYEKAKASGKYNAVEQRFGDGRTAVGRAYAMTDPQEYFAESTEAFFSTNDFFPFVREELRRHDPEMFDLLEKFWSLATADDANWPQLRGANGSGVCAQQNDGPAFRQERKPQPGCHDHRLQQPEAVQGFQAVGYLPSSIEAGLGRLDSTSHVREQGRDSVASPSTKARSFENELGPGGRSTP